MSFASTFNALLSLSERVRNWSLTSPEIVEFLKSTEVETLRTGATPEQVYIRSLVDFRWNDPELPKNVLEMFGDNHIRSAFISFITEKSDEDFIAQAEERFKVQNAEHYLHRFTRIFMKNAHRVASTDAIILLKRIDELEKKLDAKRIPPAPPSFPIHEMPLRNPNFTGRVELLNELRETLEEGKAAALTALYGLGGIGKTQVALEYAYRFASEYDVIWWVKAETEASRVADIEAFARELKLYEVGQQSDVVREAVKKWLRNAKAKWLLIFDNAPNPEELKSFLPNSGHVLITSRYQAWGGTAKSLEVEKMDKDEAREFLLKRTRQKDAEVADTIAEELGYLPLALEQAGAYMERTGKSLQNYLELYRSKRTELFRSGLASPTQDYKETITTTWTLSIVEALKKCKAAEGLLSLCAYFAPDDIPLDVIVEGVEFLPEELAAYVKDEVKFDEAITALMDYSLVTRNEKGLSIHRLVQEVVRDRLLEEERIFWTIVAVATINSSFPLASIDVRNWVVCNRLMSHGLSVAKHGEKAEIAQDGVGRLLNQCGLYLFARARFEESRICFERARNFAIKVYGNNHSKVATSENNLSGILLEQGDLEGAQRCAERAVEIWEKDFSKDHPDVAIAINNLGNVHREKGNAYKAKECYEKALRIGETSLNEDNPYLATWSNNLGSICKFLGDFENAKKYLEKALQIDRLSFGQEHPNVARDLNNIGGVFRAEGNYVRAKECYEEALRIDSSTLGEDHPDVAIDINNLGIILQDQGNLDGAKESYARAFKIWSESLGTDHPKTKLAKQNLDSLLEQMKNKR